MFPLCLNQINITIIIISQRNDRSPKKNIISVEKTEDIRDAKEEYLKKNAIINQDTQNIKAR